ncbi:MAG: biotin--[acetyl-CoA-carboxylase] ligase [Peptoniphilaceae bacterium]|nr:biotin--[acetyl-CoA-carboxylase] ligase [Peptoniphilaceae bacterium]
MRVNEWTDALAARLGGPFAGAEVFYEPRVDSTQVRAKASFAAGKDRTLWVTQAQTAGYGRMRRDFLSLPTGLYFTFALPWSQAGGFDATTKGGNPGDAVLPTILTTAVATALATVLARDFDRETEIKWVNDLYYRDRKVVGILTEAIVRAGRPAEIFCGVGINWSEPRGGFPDELKAKAGSLGFATLTPERALFFFTRFFDALTQLLEVLPRTDFLEDYEARLLGRGQRGALSDGTEGIILGVAPDGALRLDVGGQERRVSSGEVRLVSWERS